MSEEKREWKGAKVEPYRRDPLDIPVRNPISLTQRQWDILDEVRGGVPRGRYLWSYLADALRATFGEVPGASPGPRSSATKMAALPYAVAREAKEPDFPTEFEDF